MKRIILTVALATSLFSFGQSNETFTKLGSTDSTTIVQILKAIEETDNVTIATMNVSTNIKGTQRVFVWWRVDGIKRDWTRGMFIIDKTQKNVVGYGIEANKKHSKAMLLSDSEYIGKLLAESF